MDVVKLPGRQTLALIARLLASGTDAIDAAASLLEG